MSEQTREIRLAARPQGFPKDSDFELAETPMPSPAEGEVLVRNSYLSVDPYMRGRMNDVPSYIPPFQVGEPLEGGAVGQVIESRASELSEGDWVNGMLGWREHYVAKPATLMQVDPSVAPVSTALGVLGMPGLTAYLGLTDIGQPKEGETVFVSAASGAVGSVVGQLAKARGCRVAGSAGSAEKIAYLREELGFDAAFDYHEGDLDAALAEACPDGIDIYFENVGGDLLDAVLGRMNDFGRIPLCGLISGYNAEEPEPGPSNFWQLIVKRVTVRGFIVMDGFDRMGAFVEEVGGLVRSGEIKYRETIVEGIERTPEAFMGLLRGENLGKMLVKVGPDPE